MSPAIIDASNYDGSGGNVGGKAANLFRLHSMGLPVPEFFCVRGDAFKAFTGQRRSELERLVAVLPATTEMDLPGLSLKIKDLLSELPFPNDLSVELQSRLYGREREFFSVRSSALQEDSGAHSFAGLFRTFLFVRPAEVPLNVTGCWLSAFEPGILGYCRRNGINPLDLEVGVVVQRMVRSRVSGVMFTADPAGALSEIVVVAGLGIGEGIVADLVETDTYRCDRLTKSITSDIQRKQFRIDFNEDAGKGTCRVAVPDDIATKPALEPRVLEGLIAFGMRAEAGFGDYQDIEWAIDHDDKVFILQSRPITTIPAGDFTIFDNSNIVEGYPGISLPLTFSFLKNGYERNFSRMARALGVSRRTIEENRATFRNMVGYVDGRIYYNLTNWYALVNLNPALGRRFTPAFDDMIGVRKEVRSDEHSRAPLAGYAQLLLLSSSIVVRYFTLGFLMRRYRQQFARFQQSVKDLQAESLATHKLVRAIGRVSHTVFSMIYVPLINDMLLMLQVAITKKLMRRLGVSDPDDLLNGLMCGESGMESVLPVHSLVRLAELLEECGVSRDTAPTALMQRIWNEPTFAKVRVALDEHIRLYGDRCPEELKLETDTFRENPVKLVATALRHVGSAIRVADMEASEAAVRAKAEMELARQLRGRPISGAVLRLCIAKTRTLLRNREGARLDRTRIIGIFRSLYRTLARKLAAEGTLASADDIYYLTEDELSEIVHGSSVFMDVTHVRTVVSQRKAMIDACKERKPAERLTFRGTGVRNPVLQTRRTAGAVDSSTLVGTPCCPGLVEAEAIVIDDPSTAPDVRGKIIVARMTDPGWVFLMIAASGLIVEKGSLLSHTAIIGRELGIPTIVGVQDAASRLHTGQRIRMDSSKGEILALQPPPTH